MDVDPPDGTPAPKSSRSILSPAEAHDLLTDELTQPPKKPKAAESGQDSRGSANPLRATRDDSLAQGLDKLKGIVDGLRAGMIFFTKMSRDDQDQLILRCEKGNMAMCFGLWTDQLDEALRTLDSLNRLKSPAKSFCDASTDTVLTPSWWDSDKIIEARAASRRRQARKATDATHHHARSAATDEDTAMETDAGGTWAEVAGRRKARKKAAAKASSSTVPRTPVKPASVAKKPPAILVKPGAGKSFADTVRAVRSCGINVGDMGTSVSLRETRDGSLLMELPKGAKSSSAAKSIAEALGNKLGDSVGRVSQLGVQVEMEILDLDAVSSAAEVLEALRKAIPGGDDPAAAAEREAIHDVRIWPVRGGQQVATVKMSRYAASVISSVPVGWTICRVRPRTKPPERCFRCQAFGHNSRNCTGQEDRTGACWRCGELGHPMKECKAGEDRCLACEMAGLGRTSHRPGSGACAARRQQAAGKAMQIRPTLAS